MAGPLHWFKRDGEKGPQLLLFGSLVLKLLPVPVFPHRINMRNTTLGVPGQ